MAPDPILLGEGKISPLQLISDIESNVHLSLPTDSKFLWYYNSVIIVSKSQFKAMLIYSMKGTMSIRPAKLFHSDTVVPLILMYNKTLPAFILQYFILSMYSLAEIKDCISD